MHGKHLDYDSSFPHPPPPPVPRLGTIRQQACRGCSKSRCGVASKWHVERRRKTKSDLERHPNAPCSVTAAEVSTRGALSGIRRATTCDFKIHAWRDICALISFIRRQAACRFRRAVTANSLLRSFLRAEGDFLVYDPVWFSQKREDDEGLVVPPQRG